MSKSITESAAAAALAWSDGTRGRTISVVYVGVTLAACGGSSKPDPGQPPRPSGTAGRVAGRAFHGAPTARSSACRSLVTGLQIPWALAFAPDGRLFLTERPGRVRVYMNGAAPGRARAGADRRLHERRERHPGPRAAIPDFATNHLVYLDLHRQRPERAGRAADAVS